ncbi:hypothetical protein ACFP2T_15710 [Plantactinospora solaniradicis]|uniref:Uncharacterized protein n=1 Tax=Plantactinospora solaniradicis TaxID=1723736 RepID=A0ABW1KBF4_9ACTN
MIDVQVRAETGEILTYASHALDWMATLQHVDEEEFPFLGSLLPFADAMFNSRQAGRLRRELASQPIRELLGEGPAS